VSVFEGFRFRRVSSPVHDLDPRVKFLYVCVVFAAAVMFSELLPLILLLLIQVPFILLAGVQRAWLKSMRGASLLALLIFGMNLVSMYLYQGQVLLEYSLGMTLRFLVLVESFSTFFLTTSPDQLSLALEQSHVPYEFSFAFTTAVRFVPVLAEEAQTIMDAQRARGLELERGNFIKRVKNYIPILIPLIVNAIRRSLELAEAMESRAWGATEKRTNLYVLKMKGGDYALALISLSTIIIAIYIRLYLPVPSITTLLRL
jgi:energy-coupling factor transport system permease protein